VKIILSNINTKAREMHEKRKELLISKKYYLIYSFMRVLDLGWSACFKDEPEGITVVGGRRTVMSRMRAL
jgi:hypothetical protein